MSKWIEIGPHWRSEQAYQVMELLKYRHIPCRIVPEEFSFMNRLLHTDPDRTWPVLVRRKDWGLAVCMLYESGIDPLVAMRNVGHADYQTTANIYTHLHDETLRRAYVNQVFSEKQAE